MCVACAPNHQRPRAGAEHPAEERDKDDRRDALRRAQPARPAPHSPGAAAAPRPSSLLRRSLFLVSVPHVRSCPLNLSAARVRHRAMSVLRPTRPPMSPRPHTRRATRSTGQTPRASPDRVPCKWRLRSSTQRACRCCSPTAPPRTARSPGVSNLREQRGSARGCGRSEPAALSS